MKRLALGLSLMMLAVGTRAAELPERLQLEYSFYYEGIELGRATKRLQRLPNGNYNHSLWVRATGMARALTSVEWNEEGEFAVKDRQILPVRYVETRRGDKRAYERHAIFDWVGKVLHLAGGVQHALAAGTQDQGSIIYSFMLDPLPERGERSVMVTDGKDVETYKLLYEGRETLRTPLGRIDTVMIKRLSQRQIERQRECREGKGACETDDFTIWVAPDRHHIAVKLQKRRKDQAMTLVLREVSGL